MGRDGGVRRFRGNSCPYSVGAGGNDGVVNLDGVAPIRRAGMEVCGDSEEIPDHIRVLSAAVPVGVVPLPGDCILTLVSNCSRPAYKTV